jgi:hypothetical protein
LHPDLPCQYFFGGKGVSPVQALAEACGYQILASNIPSVNYSIFDRQFGIINLSSAENSISSENINSS